LSNIVRGNFNTSTGIINTSGPLTISNTATINVTGYNRLDRLADVNVTNEVQGGVPIYDSSTDKYVIGNITGNLIFGEIDGGIF
jgi:hypothetical protein